MEDQTLWSKVTQSWQLIVATLALPWSKAFSNLWNNWNSLRAPFPRGLYEVLDYEAKLELKDRKGIGARIQKSERIRYLQDNIIAFQDQAWGDGKILINYRCSPGFPADIYRSGYKSHILISLRTVRNRGDVDEFHIGWDIRQGFLRPTGFWASEISHYTDKLKMQVVFPRARPPRHVEVLEKNRQRTTRLGTDSLLHLPDGRWQITWQCTSPRLYEQYILSWEW